MSCNCEGNTYHIGMGCCTPVVANADNYYTKSEVDEKIDEITISGGGITTGEVQNMIDASVSPIEGSVGALSGTVGELSTDMENKADRSEIPSLENYYNKTEVNAIADTKLDASAYTPTDLSGYATEQWVNNKRYLTSGYLKGIKETSGGYTVPLSKTSTRDENIVFGGDVDAKLERYNYNKIIMRCLLPIKGAFNSIYTDEVTGRDSVNGLMATRYNYAIGQWNERDDGWEGSENYFSIGDGTSDANRHNIFTILRDGTIKLSDGRLLQGWMDYIDDNYATQEWVNNQDYLTEHQPLKTINGQSLVGDGNITISGGGSADLSNYYTKGETNDLLDDKLDASAYTPSDLSQYWTSAQTQSAIDDAISGITGITIDQNLDSGSTNAVANSAITQAINAKADASNVYTITETDYLLNDLSQRKLDVTAYTPTDLSQYWTSAQTQSAITQETSGYTTQQWVQNQGYLTEHQPLKTINGQSLVGEGNITISGGGSADLSNYYNKQEVDNILDLKANASDALSNVQVSPDMGLNYTQMVNRKINGNISAAGFFRKINGKALAGWAPSDVSEMLSLVETSDITSSITSTSTDAQVPSAKATYDALNTKADASNVYTKTEVNNVVNNKFACMTQSEYDSLATKDPNILYLIHE